MPTGRRSYLGWTADVLGHPGEAVVDQGFRGRRALQHDMLGFAIGGIAAIAVWLVTIAISLPGSRRMGELGRGPRQPRT